MKHTILLTALLALLVSGCTTEHNYKEVRECELINRQTNFDANIYGVYHISCPEGIYRCFKGVHCIDCQLLNRK